MAMYYFDSKVVSRGKSQNAVAKSAYNSASKLKDYQEDEIKDFNNKDCDYSEILLPKNAPEEFKDREYLWNKVHDTEKRKDSRLAREFIVALPTEFNQEDNINLSKDFADSLKSEGMIVDLNIHKLGSNNPHSHLLCTVRGIDENGEFEPKRMGNEKVRDWDTKEKLKEWRERWSDIHNKHLQKHGFIERVSHESYKNRGIDIKSTKKEGWEARKYYKETGNLSKKSEHNIDIKNENRERVKSLFVEDSKSLNKIDYLSSEQLNNISSISKDLGVYVSPKTLMEKSIYIDDLESKSLLIADEDKRKNQLKKIEKNESQIDAAKDIFKAQAYNFFEEHYNSKSEDLSDDDKIYLTHYMIDNDTILNTDEFKDVISNKIEDEQISTLNNILNHRDITFENIEKESDFFFNKLNYVLDENNVNLRELEHSTEDDFKDNDFNKVLYYSNRLDRLAQADNILESYYDARIKNMFGDNEESLETFKEVTSTEEKKDIVDFMEFYGEDKTLYIMETGKYNMRFDEYERSEILNSAMLVTDKMNSKFPTDYDNYIVNSNKSEIQNKYDVDVTNDNDIKHVVKEAQLNKDSKINDLLDDFNTKAEKYNYNYKPFNRADIHKGINTVVHSFNEIFKDRMNQKRNQQVNPNARTDQRRNNRNQRGRGHGLT